MMFDAIDSVNLAAPDLDAACPPYQRLGWRQPQARDGCRTFHVGGPENLFSVHFLATAGQDGPMAQPLREAQAAGRSLFAVALGVPDIGAILGRLELQGLRATPGCPRSRAPS